MNHFFAKGIFILATTIHFAATANIRVEQAIDDETTIDTLKRSEVVFNVHDTAAIAFMKPSAEDSFSARRFNIFRGITTFRGGPYRDRASQGTIPTCPVTLSVKWTFNTHPKGEWGGGAGWTGQPAIVEWPDSVKGIMNIKPEFIATPGFSEVIFGSLDGNIYFLDLETGKPSRSPIDILNPIKGSVSIDPRGFPILYCGQGIALKQQFGFRIFSLIDQKQLYFINGYDSFAPRGWAAFDGAALINPRNDRMYLGGENGIFYTLKLNSSFDLSRKSLTIKPKVLKYRYSINSEHKQGIENSVAAYRDKIYFADNHGYIQCLDVNTYQPVWILHNRDDTDASIVLDVPAEIPFLYTGCEVDKQEDENGAAFLKKINGFTGETLWERKFPCFTVRGDHPVNGGVLSTPVVGKMKASDRVIFSVSRYGGMNKGLLVALDKTSGESIYEIKLDNYTWSSPLDIYDKEGNMYLFLADSRGYVMLFDGVDGSMLYREKVADLFEASPVAIDNKIVIPSRPNKVFCFEVR